MGAIASEVRDGHCRCNSIIFANCIFQEATGWIECVDGCSLEELFPGWLPLPLQYGSQVLLAIITPPGIGWDHRPVTSGVHMLLRKASCRPPRCTSLYRYAGSASSRLRCCC